MSRVNNKEKYKEYDHNYYVKHKRPKNKIGQAELKIADLEAKLAEMTKKYELASCPSGGLVDRVRNLEQQLAEKDKEIERFMSMKNKEQLVNENEALKDTIAIVLAQKRNIVKHKKQLAIQELEKTLNFIENVFDKALKNCSLNNGYYDQILDFIDQQIKELKGE